jgi:hypothetical protein
VKFRFRAGSDQSTGLEGWFIDDIRVTACAGDTIFSDGYEADGAVLP